MKITYGAGFDSLKKPSLRTRVDRLEAEMLALPQVDCPVKHYFSPGIYAREISIPAGVILIGAVHRMANLAVLSKGRMLLATDGGSVEIQAPHILTVKPGAKNAATAINDCVWTNFLPNPENITDVDSLVELYTESKACELLGGSKNKQLAANAAESLEA